MDFFATASTVEKRAVLPPLYWGNIACAGPADAESRNARCAALPFADTDMARLPDVEAYRRAILWKPGERGLRLVGVRGTGKTRTAWAVIHKAIRQTGCSVVWFDAVRFQAIAAAQFAEPSGTAEWLDSLSSVSLLFLDDLFTGLPTPSAQKALFAILDRRTILRKPTLMTIQSDDRGLVGWGDDGHEADPEMWGKILRRITEFTEVVRFSPQERKRP
jgi:DNA replication protein DnaC